VFSWNRKNVQYKTPGAEGTELKSFRDFTIWQVNRLGKVYLNMSLIGMNLFYKNLLWWGILFIYCEIIKYKLILKHKIYLNNEVQPELCMKSQSVPRSKHTSSQL
jgi:hypothetical protein